MSSAVTSWLAEDASAHWRQKGRYRALCACCAPETEPHPGKPARRKQQAPRLAWRERLLAAAPANTDSLGVK